jgi:hypothetical protein
MKSLAAFLFLALSVTGSLGQTADQAARTVTSPDGAFRFACPNNFQVCSKGDIDPCDQFTYIPMCDKDALVCVVYPRGRFRDTTFEGAAFGVREILREGKPPETADECVTPYREAYLISAEHPVELIGSISFLHGWDVAGPLMGNINHLEIYRAFHKGRCFELSITEAEAKPEMSDPPMKTLTSAQQQGLDATMSDILHSFRFTK